MNFLEILSTFPDTNGEIGADQVNDLAKRTEEFGLKIKQDFGDEDGSEILKTLIIALITVL